MRNILKSIDEFAETSFNSLRDNMKGESYSELIVLPYVYEKLNDEQYGYYAKDFYLTTTSEKVVNRLNEMNYSNFINKMISLAYKNGLCISFDTVKTMNSFNIKTTLYTKNKYISNYVQDVINVVKNHIDMMLDKENAMLKSEVERLSYMNLCEVNAKYFMYFDNNKVYDVVNINVDDDNDKLILK